MGVFAARSSLLCCSLPALAALLAHQKFCVLFRISNRDTKHTYTKTLPMYRAGRQGGGKNAFAFAFCCYFWLCWLHQLKMSFCPPPVRPWRRPYICVLYITVCVCVCLAAFALHTLNYTENFRLALCKFCVCGACVCVGVHGLGSSSGSGFGSHSNANASRRCRSRRRRCCCRDTATPRKNCIFLQTFLDFSFLFLVFRFAFCLFPVFAFILLFAYVQQIFTCFSF